MARVGISIGSNLGDRLTNLRNALTKLQAISSRDALVSSVYETEPVDCPAGSPGFYNAVLEIETELSPIDLLDRTQSIEADAGRPKEREVNAPRPVDVDILYYDDLVMQSNRLTIPHPRMFEREFVLRPLYEIRPGKTPSDYEPDPHVEMPIIGSLLG